MLSFQRDPNTPHSHAAAVAAAVAIGNDGDDVQILTGELRAGASRAGVQYTSLAISSAGPFLLCSCCYYYHCIIGRTRADDLTSGPPPHRIRRSRHLSTDLHIDDGRYIACSPAKK